MLKRLLVKSTLFALIIICNCTFSALAQNTNAITVLKNVSQKLDNLSGVSYQYIREMKYYADNYHSVDTANMYIEFKPELLMGLRFQAEPRNGRFIYDGKMTIRLDNKNLTVDTTIIRSAKMMESNSYLYHSLAMLRNNLPIIIANDNISKIVSDTFVDGKQLISVRMEGAGMYLNSFKGINYFTEPGLKRPYFLLIDKQTLLPYQLIAKIVNGNDDRNFISVTYIHVQPKPAPPSSASWRYATYRRTYKPYVAPAQIAVIKAGTSVPYFKYPVFNPSKADSLSSVDLKGKVVLLEFWFKSCGPCIKAMPHYTDLQQKFGKDGFELVTINIEDPVKDIEFFYKKYPPNYKMLYNGQPLFEKLGFEGCPSSVLVDRDGKATDTFFGFNQQTIEKRISELLKVM